MWFRKTTITVILVTLTVVKKKSPEVVEYRSKGEEDRFIDERDGFKGERVELRG